MYWLSRPLGDDTRDSDGDYTSFGVLGGLIQTTFKFCSLGPTSAGLQNHFPHTQTHPKPSRVEGFFYGRSAGKLQP